jgi:hypothetical protein
LLIPRLEAVEALKRCIRRLGYSERIREPAAVREAAKTGSFLFVEPLLEHYA